MGVQVDKNNVYYLGDLTNKQYDNIITGFKFDSKKRFKYLEFDYNLGWMLSNVSESEETINALTLFN